MQRKRGTVREGNSEQGLVLNHLGCGSNMFSIYLLVLVILVGSYKMGCLLVCCQW